MKIDIEDTGPVLDALFDHLVPDVDKADLNPIGVVAVKNQLLGQFGPGIEALLDLVNAQLAERTARLQEILEEAERDLLYDAQEQDRLIYQDIEGGIHSVLDLVKELRGVLG